MTDDDWTDRELIDAGQRLEQNIEAEIADLRRAMRNTRRLMIAACILLAILGPLAVLLAQR